MLQRLVGWSIVVAFGLGVGPSFAAAELERSAREQELVSQHPIFRLRETGLTNLWLAESAKTVEGSVLFEAQAAQGFFSSAASLAENWKDHQFVMGRVLHSDGSAEYVVALAVQLQHGLELSVLKSYSDDYTGAMAYFASLDRKPTTSSFSPSVTKTDGGSSNFNCITCRNNCFTEFVQTQDGCWFDFTVSSAATLTVEAICLAACLESGGLCTALCLAGTAAAVIEIGQDLDACLSDSIDDKYSCLAGCDQIAK